MCDLATEISVLDSFSTHMRRYEVHSENCESAVGLFYIYLGFDFFLEEAAAALGQPPPPLLPALPQFVFFGLVQTEESGRAPLQIPGKDAPKNRRRSWEFAEPIQKNNNRKGFVCWARLFICFSFGFSFGFPRRGDTDRAGRRPGRGEEKKSMLLTEVQLHLIFLCQVPRRRRADETPRRVMQNLTFFALKKRTNQHTHKKIGRARNEQVPKFPSPTGRPPRNFYHFYRLR